jgi:hypothetical protein
MIYITLNIILLFINLHFIGDNHKGPQITIGNTPFRKIIKHKLTNPRITKRAPRGRGLEQRRGPQPKKPQRPTKRSAAVLLGRISVSLEDRTPRRRTSASLEGLTPTRACLRLARGRIRPTTPHLLPRPEH